MSLYYEGDTFLHRLNPLTKLLAATAAVFHAGALGSPQALAVHTVFAAALAAWARPRLNRLIALGAAATVLGQWWVNAALYHYNLGLDWGAASAEALPLAARVAVILLYSIAVVATTSPRDLAVALSAQLRVPYTYSYMSFVTLRMFPLLARDLENIRAARRVRGYRPRGGPASRLASLLSPLLAVAVRRSVYMGIAMEARGFGAYEDRSYVDPPRFSRRDALFAALVAAVMLIATLLHFSKGVP